MIGWLIVDGILLCVLVYGYRVLLAQRTIEPTSPIAAFARSMHSEPAASDTQPKAGQFPGSPPFEIGEPVERQRLRHETDSYTADAAHALGYQCLGHVAYTKRLVDGVIVVTNDPSIRCD